jgi:hypothetical protein
MIYIRKPAEGFQSSFAMSDITQYSTILPAFHDYLVQGMLNK